MKIRYLQVLTSLFLFFASFQAVCLEISGETIELTDQRYDIYLGDMDGDGFDDVYFHGKDVFVLIHGEVSIPIILKSPSFYLKINRIVVGDRILPVDTLSDGEIAAKGLQARSEGVDYYLGDFDGDGTEDIYFKQDDTHIDFRQSEWVDTVYFFSGVDGDLIITRLEGSSSLIGLFPAAGPEFPPSGLLVKDVDGDGADELVESDSVLHGSAIYELLSGGVYGIQLTGYDTKNLLLKSPELVGVTGGSLNINESGAATYSIPLSLPGGVAGVAPTLSLDYSSQGGNGLLGFGWNLSGLSQITRCHQTVAQDGVAKPISHSTEDRFCFNGQRLRQVGGSSFLQKYRTEIDSFDRIEALSGGSDPFYFQVFGKDGSQSRFDETSGLFGGGWADDGEFYYSNSWKISSFKDSAGNEIRYHYSHEGGNSHRIERIEYAISNNVPHAQVEFKYTDRPDFVTAYIHGDKFSLKKRLSAIIIKNREVNSNGASGDTLTEVRRYNLIYARATPDNPRSYLEHVQSCVGTKCLPATSFAWNYRKPLDFPENPTSLLANIIQNKSTLLQTIPFDVNGDGYLDLAWLESDEYKGDYNYVLEYAIYDPRTKTFQNGTFENVASGRLCNGEQRGSQVAFCEDPQKEWESVEVMPVDFNLDGRQDLAVLSEKNGTWSIFLSVPVNESLTEWRLEGTARESFALDSDKFPKAAKLIDLDGDGIVELVGGHQVKKINRKNISTTDFPFDNGSSHNVNWDGFDDFNITYENTKPQFVILSGADFNADGLIDLLIADRRKQRIDSTFINDIEEHYFIAINKGFDSEANFQVKYYLGSAKAENVDVSGNAPAVTNRQFVDVNADGYADILHLHNDSNQKDYLTLKINTGNGFLPAVTVISDIDDIDGIGLQTNDITGDGYPDLQWKNAATKSIYYKVWLPNEGRFSAEKETFRKFTKFGDKEKFWFYDATGDGNIDFLQFEDKTIKLYENTNPRAYDTITEITNGLGAKTNIEYESLILSDHYQSYIDRMPELNREEWQFRRDLLNPFAEVDGQAFHSDDPLPVMEYRQPLTIVTAIESDMPQGQTPAEYDHNARGRYEYHYKEARFQAGGRGALGFKQVETHDIQSGVRSVSEYRQDWPFSGRPLREAKYTAEGQILSASSNEYSIVGWGEDWPAKLKSSAVGSSILPVLKVVLSKSDSCEYRATSSVGEFSTNVGNCTSVENEHNAQGNVRKVVTTTEGDDGMRIVTTVLNDYDGDHDFSTDIVHTNEYNDMVNFMNGTHISFNELGRLTRSKITTERTEPNGAKSSRERETIFGYNHWYSAAGLLNTEIVHSGTGNQLVKKHTYDEKGNLIRTEVTGKKQIYDFSGNLTSEEEETRTTLAVQYDAIGRFVEETYATIDGFDHVAERIDERSIYGGPTRISSNLSALETTVAYDLLGREILRSNNIGNGWTKTTVSNCTVLSCPTGGVHFVTHEAADGSYGITYTDKLGRTIRQASRGFEGRMTLVDTYYNKLGQAQYTSKPYFESEGNQGVLDEQYNWQVTDLMSNVLKSNLGGRVEEYEYAGLVATQINSLNRKKITTRNSLGEIIKVEEEEGGKIAYNYDLNGNLHQTHTYSDTSASTVTLSYDDFNRKIAMNDPDKGYWEYKYNAFGELVWQRDAKGQVVIQKYDVNGRQVTRHDYFGSGLLEGQTTWYYDGETDDSPNAPTVLNAIGKISAVVLSAKGKAANDCSKDSALQCTYPQYDKYGRATQSAVRMNVNGALTTYTTLTEYDSLGRVSKQRDALDSMVVSESANDSRYLDGAIQSGIENIYSSFGQLVAVNDLQTGEEIYRVAAQNARGLTTDSYRAGGLIRSQSNYDEVTGDLTTQIANTIFDTKLIQYGSYRWDSVGNLTSRNSWSRNPESPDQYRSFNESFCYDGLNRLVAMRRDTLAPDCASGENDLQFDARGNITYKKDVGNYSYGTNGAGPHAVTSTSDGYAYFYDANGNLQRDTRNGTANRTFAYTTFDKVRKISKSGYEVDFTYGAGRSRFKKVETKEGKTITTLYLGSVEKIVNSSEPNKIQWKRYLGKTAIITITTDKNYTILSDGKGRQLRYIFNDHLGSIDVVTDALGTIVESMSFDPWGQRRDAETFQGVDLRDIHNHAALILSYRENTTRGFTGHEMLYELGIIHMNGRIYDPRLARFVQADPFIQAASNSQSYNRYSYTFNNPLNATDPSGFISKNARRNWQQAVVAVVSIVVAVYCVKCGWEMYALIGAMSGAASAAIAGADTKGILLSAAIGGAMGAVGGAKMNIYKRVAVASVMGGIAADLQGGKFGHGALTGGIAALANGLAKDAFGQRTLTDAALRVGTAAIAAGTATDITGGKFANGAATAGFSALVSEAAGAYRNHQNRAQASARQKKHSKYLLASDGGPSGNLVEDPTMRSIQEAIAQKGMSRKQCVLNGGGCNFSVSANPKADGSEPLIELDSMSQVAEHALSIDKVAAETGVDARLIRAIMYMETTHGYYDVPLSWFGANKSILPMNVNVAYWGDAFGSRADLLNPYNNIKGGALMIRAIQANMPSNSSIAQISTVYNNVNATTVSDYGARVSNIYNSQPWK